jgi:hypothetical protein
MALLWCDGFDHYAGDYTNMLDGAWGEIDSTYELSTTQARTGTYCLKRTNSILESCARRVLGGAKTTAGLGFSVFMEALPNVNDEAVLMEFRDSQNHPNISLICQSTGDVAVWRGDNVRGVELGATTNAPLVANAFQHIEIQATFDATAGAVEVRIDGVSALTISATNTVSSASELLSFSTNSNSETSQITLCGRNDWAGAELLSSNYIVYFDDVYAYDTEGTFNNSWLGDRRVYTLFPNQDTVVADWTPLSGNGFENIDDPADGDSSYISAGLVGSPDETVSEFELTDLPESTGFVSAVVINNKSRKTEAGTADVQTGIVSTLLEAEGDVHPMTPAYTHYEDVYEYDPDTGAAFTPAAIDALKVRIKRVT